MTISNTIGNCSHRSEELPASVIYGLISFAILFAFQVINAIYHPVIINSSRISERHITSSDRETTFKPENITKAKKAITLNLVSSSDSGSNTSLTNDLSDVSVPDNNIEISHTTTDKQQDPVTIDTESTLNALKEKQELQCLALNNYFEARGESKTGQLAVANVVLNRVKHPGFPDTICGVVKQGGYQKKYRCQFSWWCDGLSDQPSDKKAWEKSIQLAREVLSNKYSDNTSGALWYHADYVSPYWRYSMNQGPKIGKHIFYSSKQQSKRKGYRAT